MVWALFALSTLAILGYAFYGAPWTSPFVRFDGLTVFMGGVVTFVSGIVHSFALRYMQGQQRINAFFGRLFALTALALLVAAANHAVLLWAAWTGMGWVLADLIGHLKDWPQAQAAARYTRRALLLGSALLAAALALLALGTGHVVVSAALAAASDLPTAWPLAIGGLVAGAAVIQSALVPAQRWLLSSMTAPTPVSALMHAGIVNAGGVLLARFAPLLAPHASLLTVLVVLGGLSALLGQAWMLVQTDVKRQLACSTTAQMGFMVLQVGLGFVPAALAHLMLHGFYKAYLFLSVGEAVQGGAAAPATRPTPLGWIVTGLSAVGGAVLFAALTGKSLLAPTTGAVLACFVALTVLQAVRTLAQTQALSRAARLVGLPLGMAGGVALYAAIYNGVSALIGHGPLHAQPLNAAHGVLLALFIGAYVVQQSGRHRNSLRLYALLRSTSRPHPATLLTHRPDYHAH